MTSGAVFWKLLVSRLYRVEENLEKIRRNVLFDLPIALARYRLLQI
jgi:hypothetical protein